jgi:hypothetical protein
VILGSCADDANVRDVARDALEEGALAPLGLEEDELELGTRHRERHSRRPASRSDIDDRALLDEIQRRKRIGHVLPSRCFGVGEGGQAAGGDDCRKPALQARVVRRDG